MTSIHTMESIRSPLSGDDDAIEMTPTHRRHQSAGTLDVYQASEKNGPTMVAIKQEGTGAVAGAAEPPRVIDGIFDKKFKPENLTGEEKDKRVIEIIEQQFNLEILLKHNQLVEIEEEIGKCEAQMIALRHRFRVDPSVKLPLEPKEFTEKYLAILQKTEGLYTRHKSVAWNDNYLDTSNLSQQAPPNNAETLYSRTRSHTSSLRPSSGRYSAADCIYRRTDGVYVKLTCPNCARCNFSSAQGFLNHCRLAHQKEFTSQDNAAIICGEVLHDDDQDPEGVKVIQDLKNQGLDPNKTLAKPEVPFISQILADSSDSAPPPPLGPGDQFSQSQDDQKKRMRSLVGAAGGQVGSKTPRTTTKLKLKLRSLGKGSEFDDLVKDVTSEVKNPHLFEDEVEDQEQAESADSTMATDDSKISRNSTSSAAAAAAATRGRGRGRGRGRRKSRGGFSLLNDLSSKSDSKNEANENNNETIDDDTTMD